MLPRKGALCQTYPNLGCRMIEWLPGGGCARLKRALNINGRVVFILPLNYFQWGWGGRLLMTFTFQRTPYAQNSE